MEVAILILAAGSSSRMGQPKQLLPWRGKTLLEHTVDNALQVSQTVTIVLGAYIDHIGPILQDREINIVENKEWEQGMGTSIAKGIEQLEKNNRVEAVLIMLVDQPLLELAHYRNLIACHKMNPNKICSSVYKSTPGVPAIFPKTFFDRLKGLKGGGGAKKLMKASGKSVVGIQSVGSLLDLDSPEAYRSAFEQWGDNCV